MTGNTAARLQQQLDDAFDPQLLYNKEDHQVSICAAITATTPGTLTVILADTMPDTSTTTAEPASTRLPTSDSTGTPIRPKIFRDHERRARA